MGGDILESWWGDIISGLNIPAADFVDLFLEGGLFFVVAGGGVEAGEVLHGGGDEGVGGAVDFFGDIEGFGEGAFGVVVFFLGLLDLAEDFELVGAIGVECAEGFFGDGDGFLDEREGAIVLSGGLTGGGEIGVGDGGFGIVGAVDFFAHGGAAFEGFQGGGNIGVG